MKNFAKLLIPLIAIFAVACEKEDPNAPRINDKSFGYAVESVDNNSVTFKLALEIANIPSEQVSVAFSSRLHEEEIEFRAEEGKFVGVVTLDREAFESIDSNKGVAKTPSFTLSTSGGNTISLAGMTYTQKPSLEIHDITDHKTLAYNGDKAFEYRTSYSVMFYIYGGFFLKETSWVCGGDWTSAEKEGSENSYNDGTWVSRKTILHGATTGEGMYMQLRATTHDGEELYSTRVISFGNYNTEKGALEIGLVESSSVK